jgi:hypothetical protein
MFEMMCCRKCNTPLRRSCSLCSSQGARRDTVCLEAAVRVAPELSSTEGRARAARATPKGIAPSKQSSEDRCHGGPVVPEPARSCEHDWRGHPGSDGSVTPNNQ